MARPMEIPAVVTDRGRAKPLRNTSTAWTRTLGHTGERDAERAGARARRAAEINVAVDD